MVWCGVVVWCGGREGSMVLRRYGLIVDGMGGLVGGLGGASALCKPAGLRQGPFLRIRTTYTVSRTTTRGQRPSAAGRCDDGRDAGARHGGLDGLHWMITTATWVLGRLARGSTTWANRRPGSGGSSQSATALEAILGVARASSSLIWPPRRRGSGLGSTGPREVASRHPA